MFMKATLLTFTMQCYNALAGSKLSEWWFAILVSPPIWERFPFLTSKFWLVFFRWVGSTTIKQYTHVYHCIYTSLQKTPIRLPKTANRIRSFLRKQSLEADGPRNEAVRFWCEEWSVLPFFFSILELLNCFFLITHRYIMINQKQYGPLYIFMGMRIYINFIFIDSACIYIYMFECIHDIHVPIKFG